MEIRVRCQGAYPGELRQSEDRDGDEGGGELHNAQSKGWFTRDNDGFLKIISKKVCSADTVMHKISDWIHLETGRMLLNEGSGREIAAIHQQEGKGNVKKCALHIKLSSKASLPDCFVRFPGVDSEKQQHSPQVSSQLCHLGQSSHCISGASHYWQMWQSVESYRFRIFLRNSLSSLYMLSLVRVRDIYFMLNETVCLKLASYVVDNVSTWM